MPCEQFSVNNPPLNSISGPYNTLAECQQGCDDSPCVPTPAIRCCVYEGEDGCITGTTDTCSQCPPSSNGIALSVFRDILATGGQGSCNDFCYINYDVETCCYYSALDGTTGAYAYPGVVPCLYIPNLTLISSEIGPVGSCIV
jgi:hypothetical protein